MIISKLTQFRTSFFWLYVIVLVLLAVLPINSQSSYQLNNSYVVNIRLDHFLHGIIFFPWVLLAKWSYPARNTILVFAGLIAAVLLECVQFFLSYRTFNINDMIYNVTGVLIGSIVLLKMR
jgi:VanZ family protein